MSNFRVNFINGYGPKTSSGGSGLRPYVPRYWSYSSRSNKHNTTRPTTNTQSNTNQQVKNDEKSPNYLHIIIISIISVVLLIGLSYGAVYHFRK